MKKTIICNITMKESAQPSVYRSEDQSIPVSDRKVIYPISAFLEKTMKSEDRIRCLLLIKKDPFYRYIKNIKDFKNELQVINETIGADVEFVEIATDYQASGQTHELLMGRIVDELEEGDHIQADLTYGSKDLPFVLVFTLSFAEKYLGCRIDHIVYGQELFLDDREADAMICDMIPLYCLGTVSGAIRSMEPDKARMMLNTLLSI